MASFPPAAAAAGETSNNSSGGSKPSTPMAVDYSSEIVKVQGQIEKAQGQIETIEGKIKEAGAKFLSALRKGKQDLAKYWEKEKERLHEEKLQLQRQLHEKELKLLPVDTEGLSEAFAISMRPLMDLIRLHLTVPTVSVSASSISVVKFDELREVVGSLGQTYIDLKGDVLPDYRGYITALDITGLDTGAKPFDWNGSEVQNIVNYMSYLGDITVPGFIWCDANGKAENRLLLENKQQKKYISQQVKVTKHFEGATFVLKGITDVLLVKEGEAAATGCALGIEVKKYLLEDLNKFMCQAESQFYAIGDSTRLPYCQVLTDFVAAICIYRTNEEGKLYFMCGTWLDFVRNVLPKLIVKDGSEGGGEGSGGEGSGGSEKKIRPVKFNPEYKEPPTTRMPPSKRLRGSEGMDGRTRKQFEMWDALTRYFEAERDEEEREREFDCYPELKSKRENEVWDRDLDCPLVLV